MYTPQFSDMATVSVRRLAWAFGISMPKAVDRMVQVLSTVLEPGAVCAKCRDESKCKLCIFSRNFTEQEAQDLKAL
jgi:recombinational DNA repair protein RecR